MNENQINATFYTTSPNITFNQNPDQIKNTART